MYVGVDIGGTWLRIGGADDSSSAPIAGLSAPDIVARIREFCLGKKVEAIGVGVPGILDAGRRVILNTPNLHALNGFNLADAIEAETGAKVFQENDTVMLMLNDIDRLGLNADGVLLGVYIGTGLGSAVFIGGKPYSGKNAIGAELGHVPLYGKTAPCGCGNTGCAEAYVSGTYLEHLRTTNHPESNIARIFAAMSPLETDDYTEALAVTIAGAAQILDPHAIILGGGVADMPGFPFDEITRKVKAHTMKPYPSDSMTILRSPKAGDMSAGVRGAILFAHKNSSPV
ncbi:MAG: ROK family protein [Oscillospiraceae bacterium]|jgi:allose kinase|nr:ROK family protein [Oscillospiraceae bacterium]